MMALRCLAVLMLLKLSQAAIREPWVEHLASFFDKDDCLEIIETAESVGYQNTSDSIDYNDPRGTVSWQIDAVLEGNIEVPELAAKYDKYLPKLRDLVADRKFKMNDGDTSEPTLDWVFLRKYSAGEDRRMLKLHHDVNLFTVNVALNEDFEGGGLFYHKNYDEYFEEGDNLPELPIEKMNYDYLDTVKRENTTELVFPSQGQGDIVIHNNTLYHAVAPIEKGTRYSLIFFYDMHHPDVRKFHQNPVPVRIENFFDFPVDLVETDSSVAEYAQVLVEEDLEEEFFFEGMAGHHYEIVDRENYEVVFEFNIFDDKEEGEEHLIAAGPDEEDDEDEDDRKVVVENKFNYPVILMWVSFDEDGNREPHIVDDPMEEFANLNSSVGHEFIVVNKETEEIVHRFAVVDDEEHEDDGEFRITVGPHKQHSDEGEL